MSNDRVLKLSNRELPYKQGVIAIIFAGVMAVLDVTVFPAINFVNIEFFDVNPVYFAIIVNHWLIIFIALLAARWLLPNIQLNFKWKQIPADMKKYAVPVSIITLATFLIFISGLWGSFNAQATVWKVLIEGIFYYVNLGIIEELYCRGFLLNGLEVLFKKRKNADLIAIFLSSSLFSLGHIPGMIGADAFTFINRVVWTFMIGIFLGTIYKDSNNLWMPIIVHFLVNCAAGIPFVFSTAITYPELTSILLSIFSTALALWVFYKYMKSDEREVNII